MADLDVDARVQRSVALRKEREALNLQIEALDQQRRELNRQIEANEADPTLTLAREQKDFRAKLREALDGPSLASAESISPAEVGDAAAVVEG